jgi:nicotinamide phosphoribosyltransferase
MKNIFKTENPLLGTDFYKVGHPNLFPTGTEFIYSTWTPRTSRMEGVNEVVVFGIQKVIKQHLIEYFNDNFFNVPKEDVINDYKRMMKHALGEENTKVDHLEKLHDLGYLPIRIKALKEGTSVPLRVPVMTIENTKPEFYWLTNFLETLISCELWIAMTSATTTLQYKRIITDYALKTCDNMNHLLFQLHDFSMRGHTSMPSAITSGMGHLTSSCGTDTIHAITYMERYYNANIETELVGASVTATEHSIACTYGQDNEIEYYREIIKNRKPNGIVSLVSDTWNLWNVVLNYLPELKDDIVNREGTVVVRPDSGLPEDIICGNTNAKTEHERKGLIELLWDIFGGTVNSKGYKVLDSHIGAIYGDSITIERCREILKRLEEKGFASSNIVLGIGSYTYQHVTRDTFGFAMKATDAIINGEEKMIFKDPITDNGVKKSQRGRVAVIEKCGQIAYVDGLDKTTINEYASMNLLEDVFIDGKLVRDEKLSDIRARLR